jgi:hypothetical protein
MPTKQPIRRDNKADAKQRPAKPTPEDLDELAQQQAHSATTVQQASLDPHTLSPGNVLQLQRLIGNQRVNTTFAGETGSGVIQRKKGDTHKKGGPSVCHEYVLWRVMQESLGMSAKRATQGLEALRKAHAAAGMSIDAAWYGQHITTAGTQVDEVSVSNGAVGDVLVLPILQNPMHTMIIEQKAGNDVYIRGFNNFLTLYTGAYLQDDPTPRNLHGGLPEAVGGQLPNGAKANSYWKPDGQFWNGPLFLVSRATFTTNLQTELQALNFTGGGKCYITTACMEARGLPDDCEELTVLRAFRDGYLLQKPNGFQLVEIYYEYSPHIVEAIAGQENAADVYQYLYDVIRTCVEAIKKGDNELAYAIYCAMVTQLKEQYISDVAVPTYAL